MFHVVCYSGTTRCKVTYISDRTALPHSSTPESIALVGGQCCVIGGASWYDARNPDTCTACDVGMYINTYMANGCT